MRHHLVTLLFITICSFNLSAQLFNIPADTLYQGCPPDEVDLFLFADSMKSVSYTYDTIPYHTIPVGGTSVAMSDDQVLGPFPVGFEVSWFCGSYTTFYLCSNGWIGFQPTTAAFTPQTIPSNAGNVPLNAILGVWRDWHPGITGGPYITYQTLGVAPNRKLVVTWSAVPMYSCTSTYGTFQIVVHETSNIIYTNITNMPNCLAWVNGDGTHGTHDPTGTIATAVAGRNDTPFTTSNESLRFIPTSPISWSYANGTPIGIGNELTASVTQSGYVVASGIKCDNTLVKDSVFVVSSCIKLEMDSVDVDCTGDQTGMAIAIDTSSAISGPYTYYWLNSNGDTIASNFSNDTVDTLFGLAAGTYSVILATAGEFAVGTVVVNEPDTIFNASVSFEAVKCYGESNGKAIAVDPFNYSGLNWDGYYSFLWETAAGAGLSNTFLSAQNSDTVPNLPIGTYNVTIDGCFIQVGQVTITQPNELQANIINQTKTSCPGTATCDASATGIGSGGVPPYYFDWSSNESTQVAIGLCAGINTVTVTDANGCDTINLVNILVPDSIITSAFGDTLICITNDAAIAATSAGGTGPYTYVWSETDLNGSVISLNSNETVEPHVTTRYVVSSTDANGCPGDTASVVISVRPELGLEIPDVDTICPYDTIDITVQGTGGDSIYTYSWSSGVFGSTTTVSPDEPFWYYITVSDFCGTPEYDDSVYVQVGGYSKIDAQIRLEDDSICAGKSLYLISSGRGGFRGPDEYRFAWDQPKWDGNRVQFVKPQQTTMYVVTITDLCLSPAGIDTAFIHVGHPAFPTIIADPTESCTETLVNIALDSTNEKHNYSWTIHDGEELFTYNSDSVLYKYSVPGCYDVDVSITTEFGCKSTVNEPCLIKVLQSPLAAFDNYPATPSTLKPIIRFTDKSKLAVETDWYIDRLNYSSDSILSYEFRDTGLYEVNLVAMSSDGCLDTVTKLFHHTAVRTLYIPTAFTPNGDGLNDIFRIAGDEIDVDGFDFTVFDRWGHTVFYTKNPTFGWDGRRIANGEFVNSGSYAYVLNYIDRFGERKQLTGQILVGATGTAKGLD